MTRMVLVAALALAAAWPAEAGIILPDGLGPFIKDATTIVVLEIEKVDRDKRVIFFKKLSDLKGKHPADQFRLALSPLAIEAHRKLALDWAEPGKQIILFHNSVGGLAYVGAPLYWFETSPARPPDQVLWSLHGWTRYDGYAYAGGVDELKTHVADILQDKEVVVPALARTWFVHQQLFGGGKDLVRLPVCRVRAGLQLRDQIAERPSDDKGRLVVGRGSGQTARVPALIKALKEGEPGARLQCAADLGWIGPEAMVAMPALAEALKDPDGQVRVAAAVALQTMDPDQPAVHAALRQGLRHDDPAARRAAALGLWSFEGEVPGTFPALVEAQKDADAAVAEQATRALRCLLWIRPPGKKTTALDLVAAIKSVDSESRQQAAYTLQFLPGADAKRGVPALVEALKDPEVLVRPSAAVALAKIDPENPALFPALLDMLNNAQLKEYKYPYGGQRNMALMTLLSLGPKARIAAIPFLIEEVELRKSQTAIMTLGDIGPDAKAAIPALMKMLGQSPPLPECAMSAIRKIDPEALKPKK